MIALWTWGPAFRRQGIARASRLVSHSARAVHHLGASLSSDASLRCSILPAQSTGARRHAKWQTNAHMWTWGESNSRLSNANAV